MVKVLKFDESAALAANLGEFIIEQQNNVLKNNDVFNVAISGGSLINVLNAALVQDSNLAKQVEWSKWNIFFCDERIVPLNHADSNYGAFKTHVLDNLSAEKRDAVKVFTINESLVGKNENEKVASEYAEILPSSGGFDLLLLGCGPDGHTCSLFPGSEHKYLLEEKNKKVIWCHDSPKPPSDRITITLPVIADTKSVAFVAEGASKQDIMHQIFDLKNLELPTAIINKSYGDKVFWYVNTPAFEKVQTNEYF